jgi:hypothetical protein
MILQRTYLESRSIQSQGHSHLDIYIYIYVIKLISFIGFFNSSKIAIWWPGMIYPPIHQNQGLGLVRVVSISESFPAQVVEEGVILHALSVELTDSD